MSDLVKIAIDAMGGDNSPKKIIDGIIHNHKNGKGNFFKIFGDENAIISLLKDKIENQYYEIIHTENFVLVDPDKRIRGFYDGTNLEEIAQLLEDIYVLKKEYPY